MTENKIYVNTDEHVAAVFKDGLLINAFQNVIRTTFIKKSDESISFCIYWMDYTEDYIFAPDDNECEYSIDDLAANNYEIYMTTGDKNFIIYKNTLLKRS